MRKTLAKMSISKMLLLTMLASVMTSCANDTPSDVNTPDDTSSTLESEQSMFEADSLPDDLNFNQKTVSILWWEERRDFVEEQTGDVVDDALYKRDRTVEERLNVKLNNIGKSYTWDSRNEYIATIRSSVMSGDKEYDIVNCHYVTIPALITDGVFRNMMSLDYLDFSKPWWVKGIVDETAVDGKLYLASGDITKQTIGGVCCMFANQRMFADFQLENPVELVNEGKWTIDKVKELASGVYKDLNNDGVKDINDQLGILMYNENGIIPFQESFGLQVTTLNKDGYPELSLNTERGADAFTKLKELINNTEEFYCGTDGTVAQSYQAFNDGRVLITTGTFDHAASRYNGMTDDFWVLPYPKYDEAQKDYRTRLGEENVLFGITASSDDPNMAAAVMEAMASESYRTVSPAYYEIAFKVKYSRNDESAQMYDLIRSSVIFDFGSLYLFGISGTVDIAHCKTFVGSGSEWASYYAAKAPIAEAAIAKFVEQVKELD